MGLAKSGKQRSQTLFHLHIQSPHILIQDPQFGVSSILSQMSLGMLLSIPSFRKHLASFSFELSPTKTTGSSASCQPDCHDPCKYRVCSSAYGTASKAKFYLDGFKLKMTLTYLLRAYGSRLWKNDCFFPACLTSSWIATCTRPVRVQAFLWHLISPSDPFSESNSTKCQTGEYRQEHWHNLHPCGMPCV